VLAGWGGGHGPDWKRACERLGLCRGRELAVIRERADVEDMVEGVILGTVLGDALLIALRRLAQEDAAARSFPGVGEKAPSSHVAAPRVASC